MNRLESVGDPMSMLEQHTRLAARRLSRSRWFSTAVVLSLGLGIGLTAAAFTVVDAVVLADLPYPDGDELVLIEHELPGIEIDGVPTRFGGFQGLVTLYGERSMRLLSAAE